MVLCLPGLLSISDMNKSNESSNWWRGGLSIPSMAILYLVDLQKKKEIEEKTKQAENDRDKAIKNNCKKPT